MQALHCGLARAAKGQAWQRRWLRALIFLMNFKAEVSWSNEEQQIWTHTSQSLDEQGEQHQAHVRIPWLLCLIQVLQGTRAISEDSLGAVSPL